MKEIKLNDFDKFLGEKSEISQEVKPLNNIKDNVEESNNILNGINNLLSNINNILQNPMVNSIISKKIPQLQTAQAPQPQINKLQVLESVVKNLPDDITIKELKKELSQPQFRDTFK